MTKLPPDPVIDEIREVRHQISARFGHDPEKLVKHYMELQKEYRDRLVQPGSSSGIGSTITNLGRVT